jgi:hypothetical protein
VENPGTLVAALEPASGGRNRERLAGTTVKEKGWVTLDVSDALGDSGPITMSLRAGDGAELMIASGESGKTPELVAGSDNPGADGDRSVKDKSKDKSQKKDKEKKKERKAKRNRGHDGNRDGRDRERRSNRGGHDRRQ